MSSVALITAIIVLLTLLVSWAFIVQNLANRRQQRARLANALKQRARNFRYMLSGPPAQFLPKELTLLVQRSLIQVLEQLAQLEPKVSQYRQDLGLIAQQMAETQGRPEAPPNNQSLQNPKHSQEIKACLEELYKFIYQLEGQKTMPRAQADAYRGMIKDLVLKLTVDSYVLHGRIAQDRGKPRLAIHYFDLALKLMIREGPSGHFDSRIAQLKHSINELQGQETSPEEQAPETPEEAAEKSQISSEWDKFQQEDAGWKKKQIYD